ncbi:hypothetical protein B0H17DRAFT_1216071 [Mycena rosella]|uniref:Uncharacterized protein n=1 Tax=Mycena rosella TaxID=1033263 RepID=A0AAD7FVG6_MYCRO|nr:hypothetical protein B0H17DRAFT_1216071 [Mycena rosella]
MNFLKEPCKATDISIREEVLNASLMEYSIAVLQSAGLNDHTRWNMYIARAVQTFRTELTDVKIEVGTSLDQEKADKAARNAKIKSSNADVQMADATDTIRDAIKAEVTRQTKNFAPPASVKDSKSAPAPAKRQKQSNATASSSKPNAGASSSKSKEKRPQPAKKQPKEDRAPKHGKDKHGGGKGKGRGKGKDKAKASEPDTDSD